MLIRLSGTRVAAILVVSGLMAVWLVGSEAETMASYRALSHDALLAELAERHGTGFGENFMATLFAVGIVVGLVDVVDRTLTWARARVGLGAAPPTSQPIPPATGSPHAS